MVLLVKRKRDVCCSSTLSRRDFPNSNSTSKIAHAVCEQVSRCNCERTRWRTMVDSGSI